MKKTTTGIIIAIIVLIAAVSSFFAYSFSNILLAPDYTLGQCIAYTGQVFEPLTLYILMRIWLKDILFLKLFFSYMIDLASIVIIFNIISTPYVIESKRWLCYLISSLVFTVQCLYWFKYKSYIDGVFLKIKTFFLRKN